MKRRILAFLQVVFSCMFALGAFSFNVFAEATNGYYLYDTGSKKDVEGVHQGDSSTDFVKTAPIATIYIDEAMIDTTFRRNVAEAKLLVNNTSTYPQNKGLRIGPVMSTASEDFGVNAGNKFLIFDNSLVDDAHKIKKDKDNYFPGPLASFRFKNAAETEGGVLCDVVFTYSDAHIVVQSDEVLDSNGNVVMRPISDSDLASLESFSIAGGNLIQVASTYRSGTRALPAETGKNMRYGLKVDVNVQVMQAGTDTSVAGNFYFRIVDIDVKRTQNGFVSLHDSSANDMYSEHIELKDGYQTSPYAVYVPGGKEDAAKNSPPGYKCEISGDKANGYMFRPTVSDSYPDTDGSFYSGFLTVVDNQSAGKGVNLTAWSAGCGSATVRTKLLAGFRTNTNIVYNVLSSTGRGGNIQTTSEGNPSGTLSVGDIIGPSKLMVSKGRSVTYTLKPDNKLNCKPKEVIVDGVSYKDAALASLLGVTSVEFDSVDYWTFTFPDVQSDHTIHVNWYTVELYRDTYRYSNRMDLPPEVLATIPTNSERLYIDGTVRSAQSPGATSLTIDGFIYTFNGWQEPELTVAGADVEFVGSWTITPVPQPAAPSTPPPEPAAPASVTDPDPLTIRAAEAEEMTGEAILAEADPVPVVTPAEPVVQPQPLSAMRPANSPPTGDDTPVEVLLSILLLSAGGMLYTLYQKKRI